MVLGVRAPFVPLWIRPCSNTDSRNSYVLNTNKRRQLSLWALLSHVAMVEYQIP